MDAQPEMIDKIAAVPHISTSDFFSIPIPP